MRCDKDSMLLYVVTDRSWLGANDLAVQVEQTLRAGATFLQLREKNLPYEAFLAEAIRIKAVADRYHVPFVINDNLPVARACGADGVHVGQGDASCRDARVLLGDEMIIGVSVETPMQAIAAQKAGADYLGVGAMFSTPTKSDASIVSFETMRAIRAAVSLPIVAIGGIEPKNILQLRGSGADGVAVISAIFAQPDIHAATQNLYQLAKEMVLG